MKKLLRALLIFVVGVSWFLYASNVMAAEKVQTITAQWEQTDTTNLKEWKIFWSDTSGGPYTEILVITYDPTSTGPTYSSPTTVQVIGNPATTVKKYFVMIACGDIPQEDGTTKYECSENSNEPSVDFWIPAGRFSVPLTFEMIAN